MAEGTQAAQVTARAEFSLGMQLADAACAAHSVINFVSEERKLQRQVLMNPIITITLGLVAENVAPAYAGGHPMASSFSMFARRR